MIDWLLPYTNNNTVITTATMVSDHKEMICLPKENEPINIP
ncbi:hypothetical protein BN341_330 [Helicobacter heilmannii ASB1.4]|uniref:Uncharacterized protein n=1 Tax=Helicobacter heilmannii TaxID=35817 RepID=A0A0K2Y6V9_HELHE|nr:hypothetical protein BN341_330 [Helicobacter heilmannii ASB1.4]CRI33847.1 hypothetical protein HHE01_15330 [Helicobacter heilmannii]